MQSPTSFSRFIPLSALPKPYIQPVAASFADVWSKIRNMTSCWDTSSIATMESDIPKCFSDHKTSAVKFSCQSFEIEEQGLLSTFYCLALTNNDSGRNLLWKRMLNFPVTAASWDQNSVQLEDRLCFEYDSWQQKRETRRLITLSL